MIELSEPIVLEGKIKLQISSLEIDEAGNIVVVFSGIAETQAAYFMGGYLSQ